MEIGSGAGRRHREDIGGHICSDLSFEQQFRAEDLYGVWGTLLLPIDRSGSIAFDALADEIAYLCESGVHGIYSNGTAGEFHNQTEAEFERIHLLLSDLCSRTGKPFQIGASHTGARQTLDRIERTKALGPSAFQVILPDWWPPSRDEIAAFLTRVAEIAAPVPIVIYNPPHAKVQVSLSDLAWLHAQVPNLVGAKLAGGDAAWYDELRQLPPTLSVFIPGHYMASGCLSGGRGSYSNIACLSPIGAVRWWHQIGTDSSAALELESRINAFLTTHILPLRSLYGLSNMALDKGLAAIGQWGPIESRILWPYSAMPDQVIEKLRPIARAELPELF